MKYYPKLFVTLSILLAGCTSTEIPTSELQQQRSAKAIVVTANKHATEAGLEILRAGGSAVDAAVAVESVLSLVEPQSSGLAGGGFMVHYDAKTKKIVVYDGREVAPAGATKDLFYHPDGSVMSFLEGKNGGHSIGVPGMVSMLSMAHEEKGSLQWQDLFNPAIKLSAEGFPVSPRMHNMIVGYEANFHDTPDEGPIDVYEYLFTEEGDPLPVGHILKNPEYATTLKKIADDPMAFYKGELAKEIVEVAQAQPNASTLTVEDIANYSARKHEPFCSKYGLATLCGSPLPSSWVSVSMVMSILNEAPHFSAAGAEDPQNWTLLAEALRITYADNNQFIADDDFVEVPIVGLMSEEYIRDRAKLISREKANNNIMSGDPWAYQDQQASLDYGKDATLDTHGTTHFVIVDAQGNAVSMTATVEGYFGSLRMAGGMILNNQLTDFSFEYEDANGNPIANAVAPGKRPRSSMSPTIVLDENNEFLMAVGSPGGRNIISYVAKTIVGIMNWGLTPQEAINLPNMVAKTEQVRIERNRAKPEIIRALRDFGYDVYESEGEISGLSAVLKLNDGTFQGGADPRREGTVGILYAP